MRDRLLPRLSGSILVAVALAACSGKPAKPATTPYASSPSASSGPTDPAPVDPEVAAGTYDLTMTWQRGDDECATYPPPSAASALLQWKDTGNAASDVLADVRAGGDAWHIDMRKSDASAVRFLTRFVGDRSDASGKHSWYVGLELTVLPSGHVQGTATYEIDDHDTVLCGTDGSVVGTVR